jgi:hypothetical protein
MLQRLFSWASVLGKTRRSLRLRHSASAAPVVTQHQWIRCCRHAGISQPAGPITEATVDLAFISQVGSAKGKHLDYGGFLSALAHISSDAGINVVQLMPLALPEEF